MSDFVFIQDRSYEVEAFKSALIKKGYSVEVVPYSYIYKNNLPNVFKIYDLIKNSFIITSAIFVSPSIMAFLNKINLVTNGYIVRMCGDPLNELSTRSFFKRNVQKITVNYGLKNALAVFYIADYLHNIYAPKLPLIQHKTIHNGINCDDFSPKKRDHNLFNDYINKKGMKKSGLNAVCVMNFNMELKMKYLPVIAKIIKRLEKEYDVNFFFIGGGNYLEKAISIFKRCNNTFFIGKVIRDELSLILPLFDFFFYPTSLDILPNALLEASASGLPCLSTPVGGIPEIIIHNKTGLLANNPRQFQLYLELLIESDVTRQSLGRESRKRIEEYFSWDSVSNKFLHNIFTIIK